MNDPGNPTSDRPPKRFQFSLGSILIWIAIACLAISNVMINRKLTTITREVESSRPLSVQEVAEQFEKRATLGPVTTTVRDVRYSPEKDAFQVEFSWVDSNTGKKWAGAVELESNDYGKYYGQIRNGPFIKPLGLQERFIIVVESPSGFEQRRPDE